MHTDEKMKNRIPQLLACHLDEGEICCSKRQIRRYSPTGMQNNICVHPCSSVEKQKNVCHSAQLKITNRLFKNLRPDVVALRVAGSCSSNPARLACCKRG